VETNLPGASLDSADLREADLRGANLAGADLTEANFLKTNLKDANLDSANLWFADLKSAKLGGARLGKVRTFYKTKLDTDILSEIKTEWPEKLATIWDDTKKDWVIDDTLLEQVKKPDWHGGPEEEDQGK
jgi:hypothetical protein